MKNLLFYTFHRQLDEIYYSSLFFNKSDFLKSNFEVILHCNNVEHTYQEIKNLAKFNTKVDVIITSKNSGYQCGHLEATSDFFEVFKSFNLVIQLHPDCYIVNSQPLQDLQNCDFDIAVAPFKHIGRMAYTTDFFIFKNKTNFLNSWHSHWKTNPNAVPEHYMYDTLNLCNLKIKQIERYIDLNGAGNRQIDNFGLWHEHDNLKVRTYLNV